MKVWNALKTPPQSALKKIGGGRLKGMTDISPQWRYQIMTEQFGMCGDGWKYQINRTWAEDGADGQKFAFAEVMLFVRERGESWSDAIPGVGGSMLIAKESSGLHSSDEAYKMAVTDALSVAMKMIGVAADVYMGLSDSKYKNTPKDKPKDQGDNTNDMSPAQRKFIKSLGFKLMEMTPDEVADMVKWKAEQQNLDPNDWRVARMFLGDKKKDEQPEETFTGVFNEYNEAMSNAEPELKEPF